MPYVVIEASQKVRSYQQTVMHYSRIVRNVQHRTAGYKNILVIYPRAIHERKCFISAAFSKCWITSTLKIRFCIALCKMDLKKP